MTTQRKSRKERMFERGDAALRRVIQFKDDVSEDVLAHLADGMYACPICAEAFGRVALMGGILTEEHVPPLSLGGRVLVLTCNNCNCPAGHTVDAALDKREKTYQFGEALAGRRKDWEGRAFFKWGDYRLNAEVRILNDSISVQAVPGANDPNITWALEQKFERCVEADVWNGEQFRISPRTGYREKRANVGDLRIAFLATFASLGYRYALHPRLEIVRQQIRYPDDEVITGFCWAPKNPRPKESVILIVDDDPLPMVVVRLKRTDVFLPWVNGPNDFYGRMHTIVPSKNFKCTGIPFPWPRSMELRLDWMPLATE